MRLSQLAGMRGYRLGVAAAVVVGLPILFFGFFVDDYMFFATLAGNNPLGSPYNLYVFGAGNPEQMLPLMEKGPYPWFGDPEFKAHFFRPLGSMVMSVDHALFGAHPFAYNLHSLAWYVVLCFSAMLVLRRALPPAAGVLALLLFVADESHVLPAAWWSNRHSIMAVSFGLFGLAAHLRWRADNWRPGLPLSLGLYTLALLSAETGLCVLAYIPAYELFGSRDAPRRRILSVLPASLLAAAYVVFYWLAGFGARYSDIYINPISDPARYLIAAPGRFAMLAGAQFFMLPVEAAVLRATLEPLFIMLGAAGLALAVFVVWALWRRFEDGERDALRWLIPGAALAMTPALAAIVNSRVLLAASLGGAAIIACVIACLWRALRAGAASPLRWRKTMRLALLWLVAVHLVLAALSWPGQVLVLRGVMRELNGFIRNSELDESRMAASQVVVFNPPDPYSGLYSLMLRSFDGDALPRSWWALSFAPHDHRVTRTGEKEMEMEVVNGEMLATIMERLFRSARRPLAPGYAMDLKGLRVTVLEIGRRGPTRLRLEFEEPPESDRYQLLAFQRGGYRRFTPPALGETVYLPHGFKGMR